MIQAKANMNMSKKKQNWHRVPKTKSGSPLFLIERPIHWSTLSLKKAQNINYDTYL